LTSSIADPNPDPFVGGMNPDPGKKNLDFYCFVTSFWLFIFENNVHVPSKNTMQKNFFLNQFFVGVLKVNDENIRIRTH
jgi:hypothetical protein